MHVLSLKSSNSLLKMQLEQSWISSYKSFKLNTAKTSGTNGEANNHSLKEITNGSTITLEAGKNIVLNQNESTVSINTADAPEFAGKITAKGGLDMSNTKNYQSGQGRTADRCG